MMMETVTHYRIEACGGAYLRDQHRTAESDSVVDKLIAAAGYLGYRSDEVEVEYLDDDRIAVVDEDGDEILMARVVRRSTVSFDEEDNLVIGEVEL